MKSILIILVIVASAHLMGCAHDEQRDQNQDEHGHDRDQKDLRYERMDDGHMLDHRGDAGRW